MAWRLDSARRGTGVVAVPAVVRVRVGNPAALRKCVTASRTVVFETVIPRACNSRHICAALAHPAFQRVDIEQIVRLGA